MTEHIASHIASLTTRAAVLADLEAHDILTAAVTLTPGDQSARLASLSDYRHALVSQLDRI